MYVCAYTQRTAGFELYMVFDPLIAKSQAILLGNKLIRWISVRIIIELHMHTMLRAKLYYTARCTLLHRPHVGSCRI